MYQHVYKENKILYPGVATLEPELAQQAEQYDYTKSFLASIGIYSL